MTSSYWDVLQSLAESDEVDTWMGSALVPFNAASKRSTSFSPSG